MLARVIVHQLAKHQQQKRLQDQTVREKKKGMKYSPRSKRLSGINVYMTNTQELSKVLLRLFNLLQQNGGEISSI